MFCPLCGRQARTERGLRKHLLGTQANGGHELTAPDATELTKSAVSGEVAYPMRPPVVTAAGVRTANRGRAVRSGHFLTVAYMATPQFAEIVRLFESYEEIGGAYFRPLDNGVRAVDLHPSSLKPRIAIGNSSMPLIPLGATVRELAPTMNARLEHLRSVRARQLAPSRENQLEARMIRAAQSKALVLTGFPTSMRFIHSQWRIDAPDSGTQEFSDLLAVDLSTGRLVVVELKREPDPSAADQALRYVSYFEKRADEVLRFFEQVARMMGALYGCGELAQIRLSGVEPDGFVVWPLGVEIHVERVHDATATSLVPAPPLPVAPSTSSAGRSGLGPQFRGDAPFRTLMRRHQSWYRADVLRLPYGTGPKSTDTTLYGNMLDAHGEALGANFLSPEIAEVAEARIAASPGVEPFRCRRNMLSSQPMCFNLFGPLQRDLALATRLIRALLPDEVAEVLDVRIEYAPGPNREYLDDRTSFDAFFGYRRIDGERAFLAIETKLTESFTTTRYSKPRYLELTEREDSLWRRGAWSVLSSSETNQLWRNHLLVEAVRTHPENPHGVAGRSVVVRHPVDQDCAGAVENYRALLVAPDASFADWTLDHVIRTWKAASRSAAELSWLVAFERRYIDVSAGASTE